MTDFRPIFERVGLQNYIGVFAEEGFETWETILDITESDLDALGVKLGHRRTLQKEIAAARGVNVDQLALLNSPSQSRISHELQSYPGDDANEDGESKRPQRQKRKYRRHPKADENAPERPPSAYVLFSNNIREELKPLNLSFTDIAKRVGENWQVLSSEEKEPYETQASIAKEKYHTQMAAYKMTDSYRDYQGYLADFKAKHSSNAGKSPPSMNGADLNHVLEGKRPRLEHEMSTASSTSGTEGVGYSSNSLDNRRRRNDCRSSATPYSYSTVQRHPSPSTTRGRLSHANMAATKPSTIGSPMSTSQSSPLSARDLAVGVPRTSMDIYHERMVLPGQSLQHLSRILPNEPQSPSTSNSSLTPVDPRFSQVRNSPLTSPTKLPPLVHEPSDSSNNSLGSNQSSGSTAASSLYTHRGSEDDAKPQIVLPPLSTIPRVPGGTTSLANHALRPNPPVPPGSNTMPYGTHQTAQLSFPLSSDMGGKPFKNLSMQPNGGDSRSDISEPAYSSADRLPGISQISSLSDHSSPTRSDPLLVLADAADANRDMPSYRKKASFP